MPSLSTNQRLVILPFINKAWKRLAGVALMLQRGQMSRTNTCVLKLCKFRSRPKQNYNVKHRLLRPLSDKSSTAIQFNCWEVRLMFNIEKSLTCATRTKITQPRTHRLRLIELKSFPLKFFCRHFLSVHSNSLISLIFAGFPFYFKSVGFWSIIVKTFKTPVKCRSHK